MAPLCELAVRRDGLGLWCVYYGGCMGNVLNSDALSGSTFLITGIANSRSIAHSIAQTISDCGGSLVLTYMAEEYKQKVIDCTKDMRVKGYIFFNANNEESAGNLLDEIKILCPEGISGMVHSMAWSNKDELRGNYYNTTASNFSASMHVSCYSLVQMVSVLLPVLKDGCAILTLSYYGAEKAVLNYNVMGVCKAALECSVRYLAADLGAKQMRVNAISAGPIKTLAATGIYGFNDIVEYTRAASPMKRSVTLKDIAGTALYLLSDMSSGVTGQVIRVDCGFSAVGIPNESNK